MVQQNEIRYLDQTGIDLKYENANYWKRMFVYSKTNGQSVVTIATVMLLLRFERCNNCLAEDLFMMMLSSHHGNCFVAIATFICIITISIHVVKCSQGPNEWVLQMPNKFCFLINVISRQFFCLLD